MLMVSWTFSRQPLSCSSVTGSVLTNQVSFISQHDLSRVYWSRPDPLKFLPSSIKALPSTNTQNTGRRGSHTSQASGCAHWKGWPSGESLCSVFRSQEGLGEAPSRRVCLSGEGGSRAEELSSRGQHLCLCQQVCVSSSFFLLDNFFALNIFTRHSSGIQT